MNAGTRAWIAWAVVAIFLCLCAVRIRTCITGQDADSYQYLARQIATLESGSPPFREALFYVAPGFPALLASVRLLFGEFAGYWVNLLFSLLLFAAIAGLLLRMPESRAHAALALLTSAVFVFLGSGRNVGFLLYPFRETSSLAFSLVACLLLVRHSQQNRPAALLVSSLLLLAAIAVRESMVLVCLPAAVWVWTQTPTHRIRALFFFILPMMLAGMALALLAAWGWTPTQHLQRIAARFDLSQSSSLRAALVPRLLQSAAVHADMLRQHLAWPGLLLLGLGVWRLRREPIAWLFFLSPALLLFVFYAFFPPHWRYMLSMLVFLAPLAGIGFAALVVWISTQLQARDARFGIVSLARVVAVLLTMLMLVVSVPMQPWAPGVTRGEVRRLLSACGEFAEPGDAFYTERACRWINNALAIYGTFHIDVDPADLNDHLASERSAYFLKPLDAAAFYAADLHRYPLSVEQWLHHRLDLKSLRAPGGEPRVVEFAGARYHVMKVEPWKQQRVRTSLRNRTPGARLVWLDVRGSNADARKTVRLLDPQGAALGEWEWPVGNGVAVLQLPAELMADREVTLEVASTDVLPARVIAGVMPHRTPVRFDLTATRNLSVESWFDMPGAVDVSARPYTAVGGPASTFRVPPLLGHAGDLEVLLALRVVGEASGPARIKNWLGDQELSQHPLDLGRRRQWNSFVVPAAESEDTPRLVRMRVEGLHAADAHLRMEAVRIWVRDQNRAADAVIEQADDEDSTAFLELPADDRRH